jgi:predicted HicB family RNase H-like nuclease
MSSYNFYEVNFMENDKLKITKKSPIKGEDGYKTFSIRIKDETVAKLDEMAQTTNRSRNELINILIEYAIDNCTIDGIEVGNDG